MTSSHSKAIIIRGASGAAKDNVNGVYLSLGDVEGYPHTRNSKPVFYRVGDNSKCKSGHPLFTVHPYTVGNILAVKASDRRCVTHDWFPTLLLRTLRLVVDGENVVASWYDG